MSACYTRTPCFVSEKIGLIFALLLDLFLKAVFDDGHVCLLAMQLSRE
jgi:hypothetical protein